MGRLLGAGIAAWAFTLGAIPPLLPAASLAFPSGCHQDGTVRFGISPAETAAFHTALARRILEDGYGCTTEVVEDATAALGEALAGGRADILMEVWADDVPPPLAAALERGAAVRLGTVVPDARYGWYVPRFAVDGLEAPARGLAGIDDLAAHAAAFPDPEEPEKGRFFNCVMGWPCEATNTDAFVARGLDAPFTNVRPGSHAALVAQVEETMALGEPVLFAYWSPSALVARTDLVRLDGTGTGSAGNGSIPIDAVATADFVADAPDLAAMLRRFRLDAAMVNAAIARLARGEESADAAAARFLRSHPEVWTPWVPAEVAQRIDASLNGRHSAAASEGKRQPVAE
jgi:ABC-type proline/glycine betaine transport system substrate-binding protein